MFHQRSVSFGGDHAAAQNINMPSSNHHQNENLIHRGNQLKSLGSTRNNSSTILGGKKPMKTFSKTPSEKSAASRRRAFGDISNKKTLNGFGKDSSSTKQKQQQIEVLKPRSNNSLLPRAARNVPALQNTRITILPDQSKSSLLGGRLNQGISKKTTVSVRPSLPSLQHPLSVTQAEMTSCSTSQAKELPDIERPAGRTWKEQLQYDLLSEDDIASVSSIESFLDFNRSNSLQDRYRNEMNFYLMSQMEKDDEEDRKFQEQFQALMDREQKEVEEGIDSLYDVIDNLKILSDCSHEFERDDLQIEEVTVPNILGLYLDLSDDLSFSL